MGLVNPWSVSSCPAGQGGGLVPAVAMMLAGFDVKTGKRLVASLRETYYGEYYAPRLPSYHGR